MRQSSDWCSKEVPKMKANVCFLAGGVEEESFTETLFHKGKQYMHNFTYS